MKLLAMAIAGTLFGVGINSSIDNQIQRYVERHCRVVAQGPTFTSGVPLPGQEVVIYTSPADDKTPTVGKIRCDQ